MPECSQKKIQLFTILLFVPFAAAIAQESSVDKLDQKYLNWYNLDPNKDNYQGTSVDRAYKELLSDKTPKKTIVVAVIDSGIDIDHEDLQGQIWVNEDEVPGNGIDDDKNGYVDDIHGWNFIGNKNGENMNGESMECARIYKQGSGPHYDKAKKIYETELAKRQKEKEMIAKFEENYYRALKIIKDKTGIEAKTLKDLDEIGPEDGEQVLAAKRFLSSRYEQGFTEKILLQLRKNNSDYLDVFLNANYNGRAIVGDNPTDINDVDYGNPDVRGPRSNHGTAIAGVIAAIRNNGIGVNGIASSVRIMCLRSTPNGDERDKDVALAIRYAVQNGAQVINCSFGKPISPEKSFVDDAVKFAEQKGVLIVHSSGNAGLNIDIEESYPSDRFLDGSEALNWINVGASGPEDGEHLAAKFSNYGAKHVDIFAPGENIISTDSSNTYSMNDGSSLSAPVVSGIAALILSYYPDLTPQQMISLLIETSNKTDKKVLAPGLDGKEPQKIRFSSLSKSGGIVNVYEALKKISSQKQFVQN